MRRLYLDKVEKYLTTITHQHYLTQHNATVDHQKKIMILLFRKSISVRLVAGII
jgi:hypothetical protein